MSVDRVGLGKACEENSTHLARKGILCALTTNYRVLSVVTRYHNSGVCFNFFQLGFILTEQVYMYVECRGL